jgi:hypothetical protein
MSTLTRSPPGSYLNLDPCSRAQTWSSMQGSHVGQKDPRQLARPSCPRWCPSGFSAPQRQMTKELMCGSWSGGYKKPERQLGQRGATGPRSGLGWPAWAHFGPARGLLCPVLLPESSRVFPFCMWALVISFSSD